MTEETPKRRRWYQFRLRTVLIAVVVLSLPLSWLAARLGKAKRKKEAVESVAKAGGATTYEMSRPSAPYWACELFGDDFFIDVIEVRSGSGVFGTGKCGFGDDEAAHLKEFEKLLWLHFDGTQVTDTGLEHLKGLINLQTVSLSNTQVSDTGLSISEGWPIFSSCPSTAPRLRTRASRCSKSRSLIAGSITEPVPALAERWEGCPGSPLAEYGSPSLLLLSQGLSGRERSPGGMKREKLVWWFCCASCRHAARDQGSATDSNSTG